MAYCTVADVAIYAPQAAVHTASVETLISESETTVDSVLRQAYEVPFTDGSTPALVKQLTARMAAGRWYMASAPQVGNMDQVEHGRKMEAAVMAELRDIVANPDRLDVEQVSAAEAAGDVSVADTTPVFDLGDPTGWGQP